MSTASSYVYSIVAAAILLISAGSLSSFTGIFTSLPLTAASPIDTTESSAGADSVVRVSFALSPIVTLSELSGVSSPSSAKVILTSVSTFVRPSAASNTSVTSVTLFSATVVPVEFV